MQTSCINYLMLSRELLEQKGIQEFLYALPIQP